MISPTVLMGFMIFGQFAGAEPPPGCVPQPHDYSTPSEMSFTVDPTSSTPIAGLAPELTPPTLDLLSATVQAEKDGTSFSATAAPFALWGTGVPLLDEVRVKLQTGGKNQRWGALVSTGVTFTRKAVSPPPDKCFAIQDHALKISIKKHVSTLRELLGALVRARTCSDSLVGYTAVVITAWQNNKDKAGLDEASKEQGEAVAKLLQDDQDKATDAVGDCAYKDYLSQLKERYGNAVALRLKGGADFFPAIKEPALADTSGSSGDLSPHFYAGGTAGVDVGYFASRYNALWLSVAWSEKRITLVEEEPDSRIGGSLSFIRNSPLGDPEASGFQPGFGFGAFVGWTTCLRSSGCGAEIASFEKPVQFSENRTAGAFIEFRASSKLQVRLSLPVEFLRLSDPLPNTDGSLHVVQLVPAISLTASTWAL